MRRQGTGRSRGGREGQEDLGEHAANMLRVGETTPPQLHTPVCLLQHTADSAHIRARQLRAATQRIQEEQKGPKQAGFLPLPSALTYPFLPPPLPSSPPLAAFKDKTPHSPLRMQGECAGRAAACRGRPVCCTSQWQPPLPAQAQKQSQSTHHQSARQRQQLFEHRRLAVCGSAQPAVQQTHSSNQSSESVYGINCLQWTCHRTAGGGRGRQGSVTAAFRAPAAGRVQLCAACSATDTHRAARPAGDGRGRQCAATPHCCGRMGSLSLGVDPVYNGV